jgi:hypothetical protein
MSIKALLIKEVDSREYGATLSGLCGVTGIVGKVLEGYNPPEGKIAVEFEAKLLGYGGDDPIICYVPVDNLQFLE